MTTGSVRCSARAVVVAAGDGDFVWDGWQERCSEKLGYGGDPDVVGEFVGGAGQGSRKTCRVR